MLYRITEGFLKLLILVAFLFIFYQLGSTNNTVIELEEIRAYNCAEVSHKFLNEDLLFDLEAIDKSFDI